MKWLIRFLLFFALIMAITVLAGGERKLLFINNLSAFIFNDETNILLLGRPGQTNYQVDLNTDAIILLHLDADQESIHIIRIPRDLLVKINNQYYKINSLFQLKKQNELLEEISRLTGLSVRRYIAFDLTLVKKLVDALGGIDVILPHSITDAVSGYTLPAGQHHLNGEWAEFVIRSRYAPEGDFFRINNQLFLIRAIQKRIANMTTTELAELRRLFQENSNHYETNLQTYELLDFFSKLEKIKPQNFTHIVIGTQNALLQESHIDFTTNGRHKYIYGLVPTAGIGNYRQIRQFIQKQLHVQNHTTQELKKKNQTTQD
jgi:LCP family protein required for cell wall assembly